MIDYFYFSIIVIYLFDCQRSQDIHFNQSNYSINYLFDYEFNYLFYFFCSQSFLIYYLILLRFSIFYS